MTKIIILIPSTLQLSWAYEGVCHSIGGPLYKGVGVVYCQTESLNDILQEVGHI